MSKSTQAPEEKSTSKWKHALKRCGVVLAIMVLTYLLIMITPLRRTMPGYPSATTRQMAVDNVLKIDSLERELDLWAFQVNNIQRMITGKEAIPVDSISVRGSSEPQAEQEHDELYLRSDSLLRDEVRQLEQSGYNTKKETITQIEGMHFFTPLRGVVTAPFSTATRHPYIEVSAQSGSMVQAALDGTIVSAGWDDRWGYTIILQHDNNIITIYRNNEKLLKKAGDSVKAGTVLALCRDCMVFELWHKGEAIDPALYIKF
jgi:Membrane-bound metallopeptidase